MNKNFIIAAAVFVALLLWVIIAMSDSMREQRSDAEHYERECANLYEVINRDYYDVDTIRAPYKSMIVSAGNQLSAYDSKSSSIKIYYRVLTYYFLPDNLNMVIVYKAVLP